jgi:hypothetical protein
MLSSKKRTFAILGAVVALLAIVLEFAANAGSPAQEKEQPKLGEEKQKKKVEHKGPISAGIQALVAASTDVLVADVEDTNPSKAMEGARDTVKLKVVRTLLGLSAPDDTISVYYHLLWTDDEGKTLEPAKFEKGRRYVVFLTSHMFDGREKGWRREYELADPWLAVLPVRPALVNEIAAAVRVSHGDARSEWSEAVGPLQSRLVVYRTDPLSGTPIFDVYLDVRNVTGGGNTVEFNLVKASVFWFVTDGKGKDISPTSVPKNLPPTPPQKQVLESQKKTRLLLSRTGAAVAKDRGGHLDFGSDGVWEFDRGEKKDYYLTGKIKVSPTGDNGLWSGTMNLPRVQLPVKPE